MTQPVQCADSMLQVATTLAQAARAAASPLAQTDHATRVAALNSLAAGLDAAHAPILAANAHDLETARADGMAEAQLDRLRLTAARLTALADGVRAIAAQPDPIGAVVDRQTRPNGLDVTRVRIPLGVVLMVYEARPGVTVDAAALCVKSGNAVILRGGREAHASNRALTEIVQAALRAHGLPADAVQHVATTDRALLPPLLAQADLIDVVIPRGGEALIRLVAETSRIPVIKHYKGVCHVYVHADADLDMAQAIIRNAKVSRPSVCNACETVLIDRAVVAAFAPRLAQALRAEGVELRVDAAFAAACPGRTDLVLATDADWGAEFLALVLAVRVVDGLPAAIAHIEHYGSNHTEAIVTGTPAVGEAFIRGLDSSTVMVNASTRFADGGELGLGAEIGISTSKLHAYGPMGAEGLTTTRFVVRGTGQIRP